MVLDYIDPGYGDKMLNSGGTALADNITIVENDTYNPFGGVAFTATSTTVLFPMLVPSMPLEAGSTATTGVKISFYCKDITSDLNFHVGASSLAGFRARQGVFEIYKFSYGTGMVTSRVIPTLSEGFHNIRISIQKYTTKTGTNYPVRHVTTIVYLDNIGYRDDSQISEDLNRKGELFPSGRFSFNFPVASQGTFYVSNIMQAHSMADISPQMQVVKLPIKSTDTDMAAGENSEYIATGIGQTLLQTIDTAQLAENYGTNTAISHIVVGGYPCYAQNGAANITGISKENGEVTTHGSCSVSNDSLGAASTFWALEDKKISDLANIQVGWKAGA